MKTIDHPKQIQATHIEGPPRLVVEILSPSTLRHDRVRKLNLYARAGVAEYWIITPHPFMVEVMRLGNGTFATVGSYTETGRLRSPEFPGLELDLNELYATLPPQPPIDEVREATPPYACPPKVSVPGVGNQPANDLEEVSHVPNRPA